MHLRATCLHTGCHSHPLDHLAPLAHIFDIPLLLTDETLYTAASHFYPFTRLHYLPEERCSLHFLSEHYDLLLISCKNWAVELSLLMKELFKKSMRLCYCPHGHSDKGFFSSSDLLKHQDLSLVYGDHMKDVLTKKGVLSSLQGVITTGNYRYQYYLDHKHFYDDLIHQDLLHKFNKKNTTLLYAPTWKDPEQASSFFEVCHLLLDQLPSYYNLIIKLHPLLEEDATAKIYQLLSRYEHKDNIIFLTQYPLVYPLLDYVDLYLGDTSSIGYDFLLFDKPMFFFNIQNKDLPLFQCGHEIPKAAYSSLYLFIESYLDQPATASKKELYEYTFAKNISFAHMQEQLSNSVKASFIPESIKSLSDTSL
jgi:hypothetical protein